MSCCASERGSGRADLRIMHGHATAVRVLHASTVAPRAGAARGRGAPASRARPEAAAHRLERGTLQRDSPLNEGLADSIYLYHVHSFVCASRRRERGARPCPVRGALPGSGGARQHLRSSVAPGEVIGGGPCTASELRPHLRRADRQLGAALMILYPAIDILDGRQCAW